MNTNMNTEPKKMQIQFFNIRTQKFFVLPTIYTDRVEACVCGQNYCRDRQDEDDTNLFFRVVDYIEPNEDEGEECPHPEQECCEGCPFYSECWNFGDDDNDEEPEHGESVFGGALVTELIDLLRSKAPEAPNYETYGWND